MPGIRCLSGAERQGIRDHCLQPGCPVGPDQLAAIDWPLRDFAGAPHMGVLHVHTALALEVVEILSVLTSSGYPVHSMTPLAAFAGDDGRSMEANNSSCFNGRRVLGTDRWSWHAYGRAIDLNPVQNPWKNGQQVLPPSGWSYMNRADLHPALLRRGDPVVEAFLQRGWTWGGDWMEQGPDYHHFQKPLPAAH